MADDLIHTLARFHREVVLPDLQQVVDNRLSSLQGEMLNHFDQIYNQELEGSL